MHLNLHAYKCSRKQCYFSYTYGMNFITIFKIKQIIQVSQEESARLRESVPNVKLYRYNPKHISKVERLRR